jgi:hypothetical protein
MFRLERFLLRYRYRSFTSELAAEWAFEVRDENLSSRYEQKQKGHE